MVLAFIFMSLASEALTQNKLSDEGILNLCKDLKVADVSDGMDMVGLPDVGLMNQKIEVLW